VAIRVVRFGEPRRPREGLRIGTVRRPPRGVRKGDFARRDWFDVWLPDLAPSAPLVAFALAVPWTDRRWAAYARRYRAEMRQPVARRLLDLLAALSSHADFSIGCYCPDASRCHRSLLAKLLAGHGATMA
jgi:uncharacterized protein YeaO (DUF488 family)